MSDDIIERLDDFWPDNLADRKLIADSMREIERLRAENERLRAEIDGLEAQLALLKSGFEIAYRAMGDKP